MNLGCNYIERFRGGRGPRRRRFRYYSSYSGYVPYYLYDDYDDDDDLYECPYKMRVEGMAAQSNPTSNSNIGLIISIVLGVIALVLIGIGIYYAMNRPKGVEKGVEQMAKRGTAELEKLIRGPTTTAAPGTTAVPGAPGAPAAAPGAPGAPGAPAPPVAPGAPAAPAPGSAVATEISTGIPTELSTTTTELAAAPGSAVATGSANKLYSQYYR